MNGYDQMARFYDIEHDALIDDLLMYENFARRCGSPALELGCGTGRVALHLACAGFEVTGLDASPAMLAVAQRFREGVGLEALVAEADGQVVGFVALSFSQTLTGPKAWIDDIAVEPGYRRQGIGAALLEAAVRRARQRGCAYLLVDTAKGNPPARAFYQACGFEEGGIAPLRIV